MSTLTDVDRLIVAHVIARAKAKQDALTERVRDEAVAGTDLVTTSVRQRGTAVPTADTARSVSAPTFVGLCLYCGAPAVRGLITCEGHADLPDLDAALMPVVTRNTTAPASTSRDEDKSWPGQGGHSR